MARAICEIEHGVVMEIAPSRAGVCSPVRGADVYRCTDARRKIVDTVVGDVVISVLSRRVDCRTGRTRTAGYRSGDIESVYIHVRTGNIPHEEAIPAAVHFRSPLRIGKEDDRRGCAYRAPRNDNARSTREI